MGVGIKESQFKDAWNVDQGVSYIQWSRIPEDLDCLTTGGYLDEDTLPEAVRGKHCLWIFNFASEVQQITDPLVTDWDQCDFEGEAIFNEVILMGGYFCCAPWQETL